MPDATVALQMRAPWVVARRMPHSAGAASSVISWALLRTASWRWMALTPGGPSPAPAPVSATNPFTARSQLTEQCASRPRHVLSTSPMRPACTPDTTVALQMRGPWAAARPTPYRKSRADSRHGALARPISSMRRPARSMPLAQEAHPAPTRRPGRRVPLRLYDSRRLVWSARPPKPAAPTQPTCHASMLDMAVALQMQGSWGACRVSNSWLTTTGTGSLSRSSLELAARPSREALRQLPTPPLRAAPRRDLSMWHTAPVCMRRSGVEAGGVGDVDRACFRRRTGNPRRVEKQRVSVVARAAERDLAGPARAATGHVGENARGVASACTGSRQSAAESRVAGDELARVGLPGAQDPCICSATVASGVQPRGIGHIAGPGLESGACNTREAEIHCQLSIACRIPVKRNALPLVDAPKRSARRPRHHVDTHAAADLLHGIQLPAGDGPRICSATAMSGVQAGRIGHVDWPGFRAARRCGKRIRARVGIRGRCCAGTVGIGGANSVSVAPELVSLPATHGARICSVTANP